MRLHTTAGSDSGFQGGRAHLDSCLLHLATVDVDESAALQHTLEVIGRANPGGALVLVVATLTQGDLQRLARLVGRFARVVTVLFEPSSWGTTRADREVPPGLTDLVRVTGRDGLRRGVEPALRRGRPAVGARCPAPSTGDGVADARSVAHRTPRSAGPRQRGGAGHGSAAAPADRHRRHRHHRRTPMTPPVAGAGPKATSNGHAAPTAAAAGVGRSSTGPDAASSGARRPGGGAGPRMSLRLPTELALAGVSAATLAGFRRLFTDWSFFGRPLLVLAVSHLLAMGLRRRRVPLIPAIVISALGGVLVCTWVFYGDTTTLGLPTRLTLDQFTADMREAVELFRDVEAPAEPLRGFVVGTAIAFWVTAFLADWSAFRLWAPFEATLPAGGLFLFASLFGADQFRGPSALWFVAAVLTFLLLHRASRLEAGGSWLRGDSQRGSRALVQAGLSLGAVALVAGAATGPLLPGARSEAVVDWKELGGGDGTRVTISPLVDIQSRLVEQSEMEVFTVRSDRKAYWRLTSLDSFDGRQWRSSRRFGKVDGELERGAGGRARTDVVQQNFSIGSLSQLWLPAAYEPRQIDAGEVETRWEPSTSTLIVDEATSDDLEYTVVSEIPTFDEGRLRNAVGGPPESLREQFLQLPEDFSPEVAELARQVTQGATTPFERARALQDFFQREFDYSLDVPDGHGGDRLEQFLFETRTGYCEQFAGAFAAMARSLNLPARVAVGFTPGDADGADPNLYHVKGKHAHAWPEVYLTGPGWVLFEPTPTRGAPSAEYTGLPERQDSVATGEFPLESPTTVAPNLPSSSSAASADAGAPIEGELPIDSVGTQTELEEDDGQGWAGWVLYIVAGAAGALCGERADRAGVGAGHTPEAGLADRQRPHRPGLAGDRGLPRRDRPVQRRGRDTGRVRRAGRSPQRPGRSGAALTGPTGHRGALLRTGPRHRRRGTGPGRLGGGRGAGASPDLGGSAARLQALAPDPVARRPAGRSRDPASHPSRLTTAGRRRGLVRGWPDVEPRSGADRRRRELRGGRQPARCEGRLQVSRRKRWRTLRPVFPMKLRTPLARTERVISCQPARPILRALCSMRKAEPNMMRKPPKASR